MTGRTESRMREIRRRTRQYRQRHERRVLSALTLCSLLLLAGIGTLFKGAQTPGVSFVAEGYGSVLLQNGAGLYVLVGIAAFAVGVTLTVICTRCRRNSKNRASDAEESEKWL